MKILIDIIKAIIILALAQPFFYSTRLLFGIIRCNVPKIRNFAGREPEKFRKYVEIPFLIFQILVYIAFCFYLFKCVNI